MSLMHIITERRGIMLGRGESLGYLPLCPACMQTVGIEAARAGFPCPLVYGMRLEGFLLCEGTAETCALVADEGEIP